MTSPLRTHAGAFSDLWVERRRHLPRFGIDALMICVNTTFVNLAGMASLARTREWTGRVTLTRPGDRGSAKTASVVWKGNEIRSLCADIVFSHEGRGTADVRFFRCTRERVGFDGRRTVEQDNAPDAIERKSLVADASREAQTWVGI